MRIDAQLKTPSKIITTDANGNLVASLEVAEILSDAQQAAETYANSLVVGLWNDRGNYDASGNVFPSSGGSGESGAIKKGDIWTVSVSGTLGGQVVNQGDTVRALVDNPGETGSNWAIGESNVGYVPLNKAGDDMAGDLGMGGFNISNINQIMAAIVYANTIGNNTADTLTFTQGAGANRIEMINGGQMEFYSNSFFRFNVGVDVVSLGGGYIQGSSGIKDGGGNEIVAFATRTFKNDWSFDKCVKTKVQEVTLFEIDWSLANDFYKTIDANAAFAFTNLSDQTVNVTIIQDASGGWTVTWPAGIKWQGGTTPVQTTTPEKADIYTFKRVNGIIYGAVSQNY